MLGHHLDLARLHDLGDGRQARLLAGLGQIREPLDAQALERSTGWCGA